jgi:lysophospholipase L1-like esterase
VRQILCYGDSNTWGCMPFKGDEAARRYPPDLRWPGVLRRELGEGYWVVEEGLNGRTTVWDDPLEPHRNGRTQLLPTLLTHKPLDLVIVMLGTNDLKRRLGASGREIAEGAGQLADVIAHSACGADGRAPATLLVCPPPVARLSEFNDEFEDEFEGAPDKHAQLALHLPLVAETRSVSFFDAGTVVSSSDLDGIHLDAPAHAILGAALAQRVRELCPGA